MDQSQKRRHRPDTRAADVDESHWRRRSSAGQTSRKSSLGKGQGREHLPSTSRRASFLDKQDDPPMKSVSKFESVPNERADPTPHHRSHAEDGAIERETNDDDGVPNLSISGRHASISPNTERTKGRGVTEKVTRPKRDERDSISDSSITESQQGVSERGSHREDNNLTARATNSFPSGRGSLADGRPLRESVGGRDHYSSDSEPPLRSNSTSVNRKDSVPPHGSPQHRERYAPGNATLTKRGSSNFHSDIVDDDLMISNSKLDNALIKMFSPLPSRNSTGHSFAAAAPSLGPDRPDDISMAPVMWRVHPMEAVHRETLDRETSFLADHLIPRDMIGDLYRQNVLTSGDYHQLSRMEGQGDRAVTRLLIKTLQRRGRNAYPAFLNVLRQHRLHKVCERLLESERSLKNGILQDRSTYDRVKDWVNLETIPPRGMHNSYSFNQRYSPLSTDYNPSPMFQPSHMAPGYNFPLAFPMSLNLPVTPPTYPLVANHDGSFSIRVTTTPPPREPIVFSQLETQLEFMRKELKELHHDVHDMKSALRNTDFNGPNSTPDTPRRPSKNDRTVVVYDNPVLGSRARSPAIGDSGFHSPPPDSTRPAQGLDASVRPGEGEKSYKIIEAEGLTKHLGELHAEVKALHDDVTALTTARSRKGQSATPTDHDSHARRLEQQLEELHAQLRRLRHDVTDLKTEENQHINKSTPETKGILKPTKNTTPQYLSPNPQPSPKNQARPVTKQESREKVKEAEDRRKSSDLLHPEGLKSPATDRRTSSDSFRAPSTNGARITSESRVLSPPSDKETRVRRITSPLTVLPDHSLPWPESTRVKVAT